jgi:hypothetical protein
MVWVVSPTEQVVRNKKEDGRDEVTLQSKRKGMLMRRSYFSGEPAIGSGLGGHIHCRYGQFQYLLSADLAYKGPQCCWLGPGHCRPSQLDS